MLKKYKPIFALLLAIVIFFVPLSTANAASKDEGGTGENIILEQAKIINSGTFENGVSWTLDENGLLYITGNDAIPALSFAYQNFDDAMKIHTIVIDEGITEVGVNSFWGLSYLKEAFVPKSVKRIKRMGFANGRITHIELSEGLEYIDDSAFSKCSRLESVNIPKSVKEIGESAFMGSGIKSVEIPYGIETIDRATFYSCLELESVKIPDTVTTINSGAFARCPKMEKFDIPDSVTYVGGGAFQECDELKEIHIPEGTEVIDDYTFYKCHKLETVDFPSTVWRIGYCAFFECNSLVDFTLPDTVTSVGQLAFGYCKNLKTFTFPDSVTSIDNECFKHCHVLETVNIPKNVSKIGRDIFANCYNISDIYLYPRPSRLTWGSEQLVGYKEDNATICHVMPQYLEEYKETYPEKNVTFEAVDLNTRYSWEVEEGELVCIADFVGDNGYVYNTETSVASETVIKPTCEEDGRVMYTVEFEDEEFTTQTMDAPIPKLDHDWSNINYEWSEDNSQCTAVRVCSNNALHIETETAASVHTIVKQPTCSEEGVCSYKVNFENPVFSYQSKDTAEPAFGHKWSVADWIWIGRTSVTACLKCEHDGTHTSTLDVPITVTNIAPTCEEKGYTIYKAVYNDEYTTEQRETLDELGHKWNISDWEWNDDSANLIFCCEHNALHTKRYPADVNVTVIEPTEESEGLRTYTATVIVDNTEYSTQRTELIPMLTPHGIYGDVDLDGNITATDALLILRGSVGAEKFSSDLIIIADVNMDGVITAEDALAVLRASVGMKDETIVGNPLSD